MAGHINDVHYDDPRAVKVAGKYLGGNSDDDTPHSVVHSAVSIECKSMEETQVVMAAWPRLMADLEQALQDFRNGVPRPEDE